MDESPSPPAPAATAAEPRVPRRRILAYGATAAGGLAVGGFGGAAVQRWFDRGAVPPTLATRGVLDDASRLNPTAVRGVMFARSSAEATADLVRPLLSRIGRGEEPPLAVCGVRHSMGGQSMVRDGWVLDMQPLNGIAVDKAKGFTAPRSRWPMAGCRSIRPTSSRTP